MKTLLLGNLSTILTFLTIAAFLAFSCSVLIQVSLFSTEIKTDFFLNFFLLFSILSAISLVVLAIKNFFAFREIADLHKKWKIPKKDIIEGIYTYKLDYFCITSAENFRKLLQEAKKIHA